MNFIDNSNKTQSTYYGKMGFEHVNNHINNHINNNIINISNVQHVETQFNKSNLQKQDVVFVKAPNATKKTYTNNYEDIDYLMLRFDLFLICFTISLSIYFIHLLNGVNCQMQLTEYYVFELMTYIHDKHDKHMLHLYFVLNTVIQRF